MKTEKIVIANLKCDGCATTIKSELLKLEGIKSAEVEMETDAVYVTYDDNVRDAMVNKLHSLGYPEATEKNGLLLQLTQIAH